MKILVLGDVMLDWDNFAEVSRISPEAPVLVADVKREIFRLGGAANVAKNLKILGCNVTICGVLGTDYFAEKLQEQIEEEKIENFLLYDFSRKTTVKQRFLNDNNVHLFRGDREDRLPISKKCQEDIINYIYDFRNNWDGIVIADYNKGFIDSYLTNTLNEMDIPIFADLKPPNMCLFKDLEVVTLNQQEASEYFKIQNDHQQIDDIEEIGIFLQNIARIVLITLGKDGLYLMHRGDQKGCIIPSQVNTNGYNVVDTCGCGDVVTAVYTYATLEGLTPLEAATVANYAAGLTLKDVGVSCINRDEYLAIKNEFV